MRINVYGEELTDRIELVEKTVDEGGVYTFYYGIRFWLRFPNQPWWIHQEVDGEVDDDSSAVTFWAPSREKLDVMFGRARAVLMDYANRSLRENQREPIDLSKTDEFAIEEARKGKHSKTHVSGLADTGVEDYIREPDFESSYPRTVKDNPQA